MCRLQRWYVVLLFEYWQTLAALVLLLLPLLALLFFFLLLLVVVWLCGCCRHRGSRGRHRRRRRRRLRIAAAAASRAADLQAGLEFGRRSEVPTCKRILIQWQLCVPQTPNPRPETAELRSSATSGTPMRFSRSPLPSTDRPGMYGLGASFAVSRYGRP